MAVCPQTVHRSGARYPRILHWFGRVLHTIPTGLSTENQGLSTVVALKIGKLSTGTPHEKPAQTRRTLFVRSRAFSLFGIGLRMGLVRPVVLCTRPEHARLCDEPPRRRVDL